MHQQADITLSPPRPLPVIILADISGSMGSDNKIGILNAAMRGMIESFTEEDNAVVEIQVAVVTFGRDGAQIQHSMQRASAVTWHNLEASGRTPLGQAFDKTRALLEDASQFPRRAFTPALVLVSDGIPTDNWREPLTRLLESERAGKLDRFAMAVGTDANIDMLEEFLGDSGSEVFRAHEARQIIRFFRWVTFSVSMRSRSVNPNVVAPTVIDDFDFDY